MSNNVLYTHNAKNKSLRYTVAYNFEKQGDTLTVNYGVAQCNALDTFNRATGRELAETRLTKGHDNPVYAGKFSVTDYPGLSVSKLIKERFETMRNVRRQRRGK